MGEYNEERQYDVHLRGDVVEELGVDSPITTDQIDYYDSGIWVSTADGRDFYPYRNVLAIRERAASPDKEAEDAFEADEEWNEEEDEDKDDDEDEDEEGDDDEDEDDDEDDEDEDD